MADYLVKARPKAALGTLKQQLDRGEIAKMRPLGEALDYSLTHARLDADGWAVWEEKGAGWKRLEHLPSLWKDRSDA